MLLELKQAAADVGGDHFTEDMRKIEQELEALAK